MPPAGLTSIYIYPIKSCGQISLTASRVAQRGLPFDREWVLVDNEGKMLTQREAAGMALIQPAVSEDGTLSLTAPGMTPHVVPAVADNGATQAVDVWGTDALGVDQGSETAQWFSDYLKMPARLMRYSERSSRVTEQLKPDGSNSPLTFTDLAPLLVISEESLADLNNRLTEPVPMDRFRPSLVIKGLGEFAEDTCKTLTLNGVTLHAQKTCARCVMTTIDQATAVSLAPEPLQTLSKYRKQGQKVMFGYYYQADSAGSLRTGDILTAT